MSGQRNGQLSQFQLDLATVFFALSEPEDVYVDLAVDSPPTGVPTITVAGPAFGQYELAVRKTLALFGRAEPRDFTDSKAALLVRPGSASGVRAVASSQDGLEGNRPRGYTEIEI